MENIYNPKNYNVSEHFHLREYFTNYSDFVQNNFEQTKAVSKRSQSKLEQIRNVMGEQIDLEEIKQLEKLCSPLLLSCEEEESLKYPIKRPETFQATSKFPVRSLKTTKFEELEVIKARKELNKIRPVEQLIPGNRRNNHNILPFPTSSKIGDLEPGKEFVISIFFFKPFAFKYFQGKNFSERLKFSHEILALGNNTLAQIKDVIMCSSDSGICKEIQHPNDDLSEFGSATEKYPSACFFIDDVFYNDFRHTDACDYSIPIIQWAKDKNIGTFQSSSMDGVKVQDLTPRLGYPYLYMHQGDCEHIMAFSDVKLLQSYDHLHSQNYPHINRLNRTSNFLCFLCGIASAKWICIEGDRFPQEKVFLCTECCNTYNYIGTEKVGDFKLYPYYEQHAN